MSGGGGKISGRGVREEGGKMSSGGSERRGVVGEEREGGRSVDRGMSVGWEGANCRENRIITQ